MNPQRISRYEIKSVLGRGGMATVYLAHDPSFGRDVAVKVLPGQFLHDPTFRARFEREARTIAALEHPAIVPVYDFGYEGDQPFLVMRQMPGGSLLDRMEGGPLPSDEVSEILERIGSSLDYAHRQGIIHRDLKPGNILFDRQGNAFLTDFGIAKLAESSATYTGSGIIGTPAYMSPEQIHGDKDLDSRSDIYALGIIVYEMLTGKGPYQADTPAKLMMAHVMSPVPHITETNPDLPSGYDTVITTAMAKERDDRYSTAGELSKAFNESSKAIPPAAAAAAVVAGTVIEPAPDLGQTVVEQPVPIPSTQQAQPIDQAPPTQVPAAAPSAIAQPESEGGRKVPIWAVLVGIFALVLCLGLGTVGVLYGTGFFDGNGAGDEPTEVAVVATDVTENTPVPPTDAPEPTDTPASDTPEPTDTPEPEPTDTQEPTKEPLTFAKVQDESGRISLQFPRQWESVTTDLGVWGSSDFDEWSDSFNMTREGDVTTPGLFLMAIDEEDPVDEDFIEFFVDDFDFPENCDPEEVVKEDYDDGVYIGMHVTVLCGSGEFVLLLAFDPNNPTFLIWLEAFILSVIDDEVLAKAFETFSVNPPSAVTETEPTSTATSQPAAGGGGGAIVPTSPPPPPQQDTRTVLLEQMRTTRADMARMGGMIDTAVNTGYISCQDVIRTYDAVANSPSFDISGSTSDVRTAHNSYRESIQVFTNGTSNLAENCRTFLAGGGSGSIPFSQWGQARQTVNQALDIINPAIERLE